MSRHRQLNAWRMEITTVQETFSCKTTFFKIDQLIAENPKSSKQTFNLSHVTLILLNIMSLDIDIIYMNDIFRWLSSDMTFGALHYPAIF